MIGIDVTNTISTSSVLSTNVEFKNVITNGLKLNANGALAPGGYDFISSVACRSLTLTHTHTHTHSLS